MPSIQQAKVKSVLSGDTLILTSVNNPRNERTLSLAFVTAPRLRREGDETFAVESRDFIRGLLVGRVIQFRVLYTLPTGAKRDYGMVTLQDGQQLPELAVAEGYLKLRDDAGKREESEEVTAIVERLRELESKAKAQEKGIWSSSAEKIQTAYELPDPQAFVQRVKGQSLQAMVEKILTGDRLIVRLAETPTEHVQTMLLIAGIRAPNTKRTNTTDGQELPAEPLGEEAQIFVEDRLLQRKVTVNVLGLSPQNQLVGAVKHPNGDIAVFELKAGLARCVDHHSTMLGGDMAALRQAEKFAKDNRVGLFKGMAAQKAGGKESEAVVSRVQSADTLYLRFPNGTERRVNLSSVRQPKPTDPKQSPFGAEAKEYMRKKLIGKHVKVSIDGKRPATEGYEEREMATLTHANENVTLELVKNGWASVLRHRMDDTDRSPIYDELLAAEEEAQQGSVGMWAARPPETKQVVDYSENLEKAKRLHTLLSKQKRVPAIVDYVKSGSRFTLLIPRENAKLTFVLSGIQAPKSARSAAEASEPFGREAHDLANKRLNQRDVEIDVEENDKVGGFIGKLYVNRENFAKILLEEGYASVRMYSAEKSGNAAELKAAEQKAKEARKGLWENWDPSQDVEDGAEDGDVVGGSAENGVATEGDSVQQSAPSKDYRDVVVTYADPATCRLKLQIVSQSTTGALSSLMSSFRSLNLSNSPAIPTPPKAGDLVSARFSEDGAWYRARIRRNDRDAKTSEVLYIDYGNSETIPWASLRTLPQPDRFGTSALKPQAVEAQLSFIQFPAHSADYMAEAQEWLLRRCPEQLVARVDHTDARDGVLCVTLFDPKDTAGGEAGSINAEVLEEGLGMVPRKLSRWERAQGATMKVLKGKEEEARKERRGIFEYGDLSIDD